MEKITLKQRFWNWYERTYKANLNFAATVFLLQIVHLVWLTTDVVLHRALGTPAFLENVPAFQFILSVVDYLEIPAIITVSIIYYRAFTKEGDKKALWYLLLLNTQWLHIFWISDEFVVDSFTGHAATVLPPVLAWIAIGIDYLEIPVMVDTLKRVLKEGKKGFAEGE